MRQSGKVWELEEGVTCVVCPDCAFTFDAVHENEEPEGSYSCPLCAELALGEELRECRRLHAELYQREMKRTRAAT